MDRMTGQPLIRRARRKASQDSRDLVSSGKDVAGKGVRFILGGGRRWSDLLAIGVDGAVQTEGNITGGVVS